jgi:hypothetical protein
MAIDRYHEKIAAIGIRNMIRFRPQLAELERRDAPTTVQEVEPNNSVSTANSVPIATGNILTAASSDWLTIQAVVDTVTDRDYFSFNLTAASGFFFNLDSRDTGLSSTLDAVLDVYNSTGTTLLGDSDEGYDFEHFVAPTVSIASATSPDPSLYLDLAPGTYIARVMSFQSATVGAYQLRMLADPNYSTTVPPLASRPTALVSLYLDFGGYAATDDWGTYSATAFDLNGQPGTFTPGENYTIRNIWRIVSEDFAPFNVNVTTTEPPSFADGTAYRLVFTSSDGSVVGQSATARGAAIVGSFGGPGVNTGFVYQPGFGDYEGGISGLMVATALEEGNEASQEFGRALGMKHYGGINSQPTGIMQVPATGLNRATWSAGLTHSGEPPVVMQDDVSVITAPVNGITYVPDDYSDTFATATPITTSGITGMISSATDGDMFQFTAPQGNAILNATADGYSGNVDLELRVYNATGQQLVAVTPSDSFNAGVTIYIPTAGTYNAEVRGANVPGAIGNYRLDLSFAPVTGPGQVLSTIVNGGAIQRSMVRDLTVQFSRPMQFPNGVPAAFTVMGPSGAVPINIDLSNSTPSQTIALIRFPNASGGFGSVADGNYQLTIIAANCLDDNGQQLDGDSNGTPGGNYLYSFYRLYGDANGDRTVSASDFIAFRLAFGGTSTTFDFDGDGAVAASDFIQFRLRFGATI